MAIVIGVVVSAVIVALGGRAPDSVLSWGVAILLFAIAGWLSFKLLAMGLNTGKVLEEPEVADPARAASLESKGRSAGAVAGRGAAALMKRGRKGSGSVPPTPSAPSASAPAPDPAAEAPTTPTPGAAPEAEVTVDKAARVLGSMVGRRLGDRKKG
jgi:hypothetical protein